MVNKKISKSIFYILSEENIWLLGTFHILFILVWTAYFELCKSIYCMIVINTNLWYMYMDLTLFVLKKIFCWAPPLYVPLFMCLSARNKCWFVPPLLF